MTRPAALREAVANLYNVQYRQNKKSKYTYENVCIVPGGRSGLSRIAAVISNVYCVSLFVFVSESLRCCGFRRFGRERRWLMMIFLLWFWVDRRIRSRTTRRTIRCSARSGVLCPSRLREC